MSERSLKIALACSAALNLFLVAGGVSAVLWGMAYLHEHPFAVRRDTPLAQAAHSLPAETRVKLDQTIRAAAKEAAPDFHAARDARKAASDLASATTFDRAAIVADMDQARAAENRGRVHLESAFLDVMQSLPADQRAKLAPVLRGRQRRPGQPPAAAKP